MREGWRSRFHQADVSFLNQIKEWNAGMSELSGDRDYQAQVAIYHL
jgi:hypothetical protein